jgi:hypothetical protein
MYLWDGLFFLRSAIFFFLLCREQAGCWDLTGVLVRQRVQGGAVADTVAVAEPPARCFDDSRLLCGSGS